MSHPIFTTLIDMDGRQMDCKGLEPRYTTNDFISSGTNSTVLKNR